MSDVETPAPEAAPEVEWRRLSPRMLLIHPIGAVRSLLPALLPILVVGNSNSNDGFDIAFNIGAAVFVLLVAVWRWMTTSFRITEHQVQLRQGIVQRTTLTLPLDRVRTVDLESTLVHRLLGLTKAVVGTGAHADKQPFVLDGLTTAEAEQMRVRLLHERRAAAATGEAPAGEVSGADPSGETATVPAPVEEVLVPFDPSWVRFAPLSTVGIVTGLATLAFIMQGAAAFGLSGELVESLGAAVVGVGLVVGLLSGAVGLVVTTVVGAVVSYVLTSWGHTVVRHDAGTIRISRGLLTTRSTTIDLARLRGVRLREAILLRSAGGAQLTALVTGIGEAAAQSALLMPASPVGVDRGLAGLILRTTEPLDAPLTGHGVRAVRRRWFRALWSWLFVLVPSLAAVRLLGWPWWVLLPALLVGLALVPVAADRARALGHALTVDHLVAREGSIERATSVLDLDGIIGWDVRSTFFQRRAGLCTLTAMTAAGSGGVRLLDIPEDRAYEIVHATERRLLG